ncbi:putative transcriptional regulator [Rhodococcus sp. 27YEA15]|uniref:helix-turn-helix domain-containing protein n=1 Tax=Rhodococcus sp. 27YEA15 TaxID=3156259 RepID=UPI003C7E4D07
MKEMEARMKPGLLDRLKRNAGIRSDEAFAAAIGSSRATLDEVRRGSRSPSMGFAIGVCRAFGLGLGEVVEFDRDDLKVSA